MAGSVGGKAGFGAVVVSIIGGAVAAIFGGSDKAANTNGNVPDPNAPANNGVVENGDANTPPVENGTTPPTPDRPIFTTLPELIAGLDAAIGDDGLDREALQWVLAEGSSDMDVLTADALLRSLRALRDNERAPFEGPRTQRYLTAVLPVIVSEDEAGSLRVTIAE